MKKILAWLMLLTMVVGLFAGCNQTGTTNPTDPSETVAGNQEATGNAQDAIDYLKGYYTDSGAETPIAYTRFGIVRVAGVPYDVVWTTNVSEDLVKIVKNEDGSVTIQVNEEATEATEYTLTATVTDANGKTATHTWNYILPKGQDMVSVVEAAYALENGASLPYESRLKGKVIEITSIYTEEYQNISVVIEVAGAEDKPITCYRMKGTSDTLEQLKRVSVGNIITVTGTIKNYQGTIEFDSGCLMVAWELGDAVEAPTDPAEILTAAYALEQGKSLPYAATLTGKVTAINTPYDASYGNISVTITVDGYEKYPILCYRLKGTGVDQLAVGDIITVSGIIKNYNGTIEYDSGCQLQSFEMGDRIVAPEDPYEILDAAYALDWDESLPYEATLSGIVTSVDEAYTEKYGNITVTIAVPGALDQPITCYRMKGDGVESIKASDTITVRGIIKNYKGTREFDTGCQLVAIVAKGPGYYAPATQEEIIEDIKTLPVTCTLLYEATLEGEIVKVNTAYSSQYGNITVTIRMKDKNNQDFDLKLYRLKGDGIENLAKGNTIKVKGYLTNYVTKWDGSTVVSSSKQMINGVLVESNATAPEVPDIPEVNGTKVAEVVIYAPAYNKALSVTKTGNYNVGVDVSVSGTSVTGYGATEIFDLIQNEDGTYSFANGGKKLGMATEYTSVNLGEVYSTWNVIPLGNDLYNIQNMGRDCYIEWYNKYENWSTYNSSYAATDEQFQLAFYVVSGTLPEFTGITTGGGSTGGGETTTNPEAVIPELGKAYKFGMVQGNVDNKLFYINGAMDSFYLDTTEDAAAAVDVYLEAADGGYYLYAMVGGAKKYINMVASGSYVNGKYEDTASTVYTIDEANCSVMAEVNGENYSFGTRNDKSYTTVGPFKSSYTTNFFCKFYPAEGGSTGGGESGGESGGETGTVSNISAALAGSEGSTFTVKGVVTLVDGKNIYLQDGTGAICVRMNETPADISLYDTVIGTGSKTVYNGLPQLGSGTYEKSSDNMAISVKPVTIGSLTTADLCKYVKLENMVVTMSGSNVTLSDGSKTLIFYKAVLPANVESGDTVTVTGALSIYKEDYQLRNTLATEVTLVSKGEGSGSTGNGFTAPAGLKQVNFADIKATDKVVIIMYAPVTDSYYVMLNNATKGPASVITSATALASTMYWNFIGDATNGFKICPAGQTAEWLYLYDHNNGVRIGTEADNKFTYSNGYLSSKDTAGNTRYIGVYDNNGGDASQVATPNFRSYKNTTGNTKDQMVYFYVVE